MKLHFISIAALPVVTHIVTLPFCLLLPTATFGLEIEEEEYGFMEELSDLQAHLKVRLLDEDDSCSSVCEDDNMSRYQASIMMDIVAEGDVEEEGDMGFFGKIFDSITGFFGRLMNRIFTLFIQREEVEPKYMVSTEKILPLISNYTTKFNSLAKTMRRESESSAALSTTPAAIRMLYNMSAMNMEYLATVLDPIVDDMRQNKTMDFRTISCGMMQVLTSLRDVTVPNIQTMAEVIYTKSNHTDMQEMFKKYKTSTASTTELMTTSTNEDSICLDVSRTTTSARLFGTDILSFLFNSNVDVGPIGHIVSIILLILLFPVSLVVSILGAIAFIIFLLVVTLTNFTDLSALLFFILFGAAFLAPFSVVTTIWRNIQGFVEDILDPFLPDRPTASPVMFPNPSSAVPVVFPTPTNPPGRDRVLESSLSPQETKQVNDVMYRLSIVLSTPLDTVTDAMQSKDSWSNMNRGEEDEMNCEVASLSCKNDALIDVLPF